MNDLFIARKISELPKEPNTYYTFWLEPGSQQIIILGADIYDPETRQFEVWDDESEKGRYTQPDGWLEPTTLENLIAENPQVLSELVLNAKFCHDLTAELIEKYRREGFEAARKEDRFSEVVADGNDYVYSTVQDYINSLKDKKDEKI